MKATAHKLHISVEVIGAVFPGKLISCFAHITWPTHSPNLAVPDYFFLDYVKKAKYTKYILLNLWIKTANSGINCRNPKETLQQLHPFHNECSSVPNNMVVTYEVSYSNGNDSHEFPWDLRTSVNKIFPLPLKVLFHLKNRQMFLTYLYYTLHTEQGERNVTC